MSNIYIQEPPALGKVCLWLGIWSLFWLGGLESPNPTSSPPSPTPLRYGPGAKDYLASHILEIIENSGLWVISAKCCQHLVHLPILFGHGTPIRSLLYQVLLAWIYSIYHDIKGDGYFIVWLSNRVHSLQSFLLIVG